MIGLVRRRSDAGEHPSLPPALRELLRRQYRDHPAWSYRLHHDNLAACVRDDPALGPLPSATTVRRYMQRAGLVRQRRKVQADTAAARAAEARRQRREVRSYEVEHVGGLWHSDYHCCSRTVLTPGGTWVRPWLMAVLDDHSRLVCHAQWYLGVCSEHTAHALSQAIAKRGLPRRLMHDNGKEYVAAEIQQGLVRLGITAEPTMEYCPEQNGKQERWWGHLEGRLMAMVERVRDLSLAQLNLATQAWVEGEYHRRPHAELAEATPLDRFCHAPDVLRDPPSAATLRLAFTQQERRRVRRSDGTISLGGGRYEIPARFRHLTAVAVRWARWDLARVHLVDPRTETVLERIYPLDKAANADGRRRAIRPAAASGAGDEAIDEAIPPVLQQLIDHYLRDGVPPAYLPRDERAEPDEEDTDR